MMNKLLDKVIFGGVYKANLNNIFDLPKDYTSRLNGQRYNCWIPVRVVKNNEDKIYMIDTYQLKIDYQYGYKTHELEKYNKFVEYLVSLGEEVDRSWLTNCVFDYYYSARVELKENNIKTFTLIADLKEYKPIVSDLRSHYNDEDIKHLMLWNYQNSGYGTYLLHNNADINYKQKINNLYYKFMDDLSTPSDGYESKWNNLVKCVAYADNHNKDYDKNLIEYAIKMRNYIQRLSKNYQRYEKKIRNEFLIKGVE